MKQKQYESVVIINATLEDDKVEGIIKKIQGTLTNGGAKIIDVDKWGRKRLAYPIKKQKTGYYVVLRFISEPSFISKLERFYRLEEEIYRSLTVILDKEALAYIEKQKKEAEEKGESAEVTVQNEKAEEVVEETTTEEEKNEDNQTETESETPASESSENVEEKSEE